MIFFLVARSFPPFPYNLYGWAFSEELFISALYLFFGCTGSYFPCFLGKQKPRAISDTGLTLTMGKSRANSKQRANRFSPSAHRSV